MDNHRKTAGIGLLIGVISWFVFMFVGELGDSPGVSGNTDTIAMVVYGILCLAGGYWLGHRNPKSVSFAGACINLPMWLMFSVAALVERGPIFRQSLPGLLAGLVLAYAGSYLGSRLPNAKRKTGVISGSSWYA